MTTNPSLVERLRQWARQQAEASKMLAEAKTARQTDGGCYVGGEPEQMVGWEAANRIEHLESLLRKIISEGQGGATAEELVLIAGRIDQ